MHNAKAGGEIGANGQFYKGGQFVADSNRPKGFYIAPGPHKINVAPYKWISAGWGTVAIYEKMGNRLHFNTTWINNHAEYSNWHLSNDNPHGPFWQALLDMWLDGIQTMTVCEFCELARYYNEQQAYVKLGPGNKNVHRAIDVVI